MFCCCCCESNDRTITKQKFVSRFQKWIHIAGPKVNYLGRILNIFVEMAMTDFLI
jgi:hypothetical protein